MGDQIQSRQMKNGNYRHREATQEREYMYNRREEQE
jgi:hypothetical protein